MYICVYTYIHTMEYYSAIKKNEIMSFATTWMDLETIILSEVRWRKTNILSYHLHVESKKNDINELIYKTEIDSQTNREQTYGYQRGEQGVGGEIN